MYALVMMVCYLNGSCENLYLGGFETEEQCVRELKVQRIHRGGCLPLENVLDDFWQPATRAADFHRVF
ncbi:DUF1482 family protein [Hafnia paralvei]|uniref:DUF1482 family protein n=1 Tax=Hafnia paralvei TaxID=546367 RepID=UPI003C2CEEBB